jgi:hypothetical protein
LFEAGGFEVDGFGETDWAKATTTIVNNPAMTRNKEQRAEESHRFLLVTTFASCLSPLSTRTSQVSRPFL